MNNDRLTEIREAEKASHLEIYSTAELYEKGSWLQKPIKTVLDLLPIFVYWLLNSTREGLREVFGTVNDYNGKYRGN